MSDVPDPEDGLDDGLGWPGNSPGGPSPKRKRPDRPQRAPAGPSDAPTAAVGLLGTAGDDAGSGHENISRRQPKP